MFVPSRYLKSRDIFLEKGVEDILMYLGLHSTVVLLERRGTHGGENSGSGRWGISFSCCLVRTRVASVLVLAFTTLL